MEISDVNNNKKIKVRKLPVIKNLSEEGDWSSAVVVVDDDGGRRNKK